MNVNSSTIKKAIEFIGAGIKKNSPTLLTILGISGLGATAIMTAKASMQAKILLDAAKEKKQEELTTQEIIEISWKSFIPPVALGVATSACIIGINSTHKRRYAALAGLYSISETALKEYQEQVLTDVGPTKAQKISDEVAQTILDKNPVSQNTIYITGKGDTLCYDVLSGRYFKSDIETLRQAQNNFNEQLFNHALWLSVNDLYYEIDLPGIKLGEQMGWSTDEKLEMRFPTKLADNGEPCLVLDYSVGPRFFRS